MSHFKELLETTYFLPIVIYLLLLALMYFAFKLNNKLEKISTIQNDSDTDVGFWNMNDTMVAAYVALFQNYKNLDEDYFDLLVRTTGRTKGALSRKFSRINSIIDKRGDASELDERVYSVIAFSAETFAISQFEKSFKELGGNLDELQMYID